MNLAYNKFLASPKWLVITGLLCSSMGVVSTQLARYNEPGDIKFTLKVSFEAWKSSISVLILPRIEVIPTYNEFSASPEWFVITGLLCISNRRDSIWPRCKPLLMSLAESRFASDRKIGAIRIKSVDLRRLQKTPGWSSTWIRKFCVASRRSV